jgi:hypothetical protein
MSPREHWGGPVVWMSPQEHRGGTGGLDSPREHRGGLVAWLIPKSTGVAGDLVESKEH